jgi:hypothetical protein
LDVDEVPGEPPFVAVPGVGVVLVDVSVLLDRLEETVGLLLELVLDELALEVVELDGVEVGVQSRAAS